MVSGWSFFDGPDHGHGHGHGCHDPDGHFLMVLIMVHGHGHGCHGPDGHF